MEGSIGLALSLGLLLSLLFSEVLGVMPGGMVVSGYLALEIQEPVKIAATLLMAGVTFGIIRLAGHFVFLYGQRRFLLTLLLGFLVTMISRRTLGLWSAGTIPGLAPLGLAVPGLIANRMQSQGPLRTTAVTLVVTISVYFLFTILTTLLPAWFVAW